MGRPKEKIAEEKIREIVRLYKETDLNKKEICEKVGIGYKKLNQLFKDLNIPKKKSKSRGKCKGESKLKIKIDLNKVKELKEELYDYKDIAKILGIGITTLKLRIKEDKDYVECGLRANKKLAGKVQQVIDYYNQVESIIEVSKKFNVHTNVLGLHL